MRFFVKITKNGSINVGSKNAELKKKKVKIKARKMTEDEARVRERVFDALSNHSILARQMYKEWERMFQVWLRPLTFLANPVKYLLLLSN